MEEDKSLPGPWPGNCFPKACIVVRYNISYNNPNPPKISAGCGPGPCRPMVPKLVRTVTQTKVVIKSYYPEKIFHMSGRKFLLQWSVIQTNIVVLVPRYPTIQTNIAIQTNIVYRSTMQTDIVIFLPRYLTKNRILPPGGNLLPVWEPLLPMNMLLMHRRRPQWFNENQAQTLKRFRHLKFNNMFFAARICQHKKE